jgi:hypothetical protein
MIGNTFYENYSFESVKAYKNVKDLSWPECLSKEDFERLPFWIQEECITIHGFGRQQKIQGAYEHIFDRIRKQGNSIKSYTASNFNGAMVSRIGKDLYFGTSAYSEDVVNTRQLVDQEFKHTRNHVVNTGGHGDGTYCPVCPGLIISLRDVPTYADTFPDWEVVYLPGQSWDAVRPFLDLKQQNNGRWWIPGFEKDQAVIDVVESWLGHWTGYVEETVFDVNMLVIDEKNVVCNGYNEKVFDAFSRYGITPHVINFRHRYFWDGGLHCITSDLHREGTLNNYFPERV